MSSDWAAKAEEVMTKWAASHFDKAALRGHIATALRDAARVPEERCAECNGELSACGEMTPNGPSMDCEVCILRSTLEEVCAERDRLQAALAQPTPTEVSVDLDKFSNMMRLPAQHADDAGCKCMHCQIYEAGVAFVRELRQLRREVALLREAEKALGYYADRKTYTYDNGLDEIRVLVDGGNRARTALKALEAAREG